MLISYNCESCAEGVHGAAHFFGHLGLAILWCNFAVGIHVQCVSFSNLVCVCVASRYISRYVPMTVSGSEELKEPWFTFFIVNTGSVELTTSFTCLCFLLGICFVHAVPWFALGCRTTGARLLRARSQPWPQLQPQCKPQDFRRMESVDLTRIHMIVDMTGALIHMPVKNGLRVSFAMASSL